jgi:molybdate transport system substrate-binding protein
MRNTKKLFTFLLSFILILSLAGCGTTPAAQQQAAPVNLTVSAAASLKSAMEEIKTNYAQENSNVTITYNFAGSGSLQQQIEQGAAVDIFVSAGTKQMDALKDKGLLLDDTSKNLLGNQLVLITPKSSTTVSNIKDLTSDKVKKIALGEPKSVPAGQYAEESLTKLKPI